jgi:hypothetical protein
MISIAQRERAMWWHVACEALQKGVCLEISYDGHSRTVEVHAVGTSTAGNPVMRAFQVRCTKPGGNGVWRLFRLDKTWRFALGNERSQAPRGGYRPNDEDIAFIRCQIKAAAIAVARRKCWRVVDRAI